MNEQPKRLFLEGKGTGRALLAKDRWLKLAITVRQLGGFVGKACFDAINEGSIDFFHPEVFQDKQKFFFNKRHWIKKELIDHYKSLPEDRLNY